MNTKQSAISLGRLLAALFAVSVLVGGAVRGYSQTTNLTLSDITVWDNYILAGDFTGSAAADQVPFTWSGGILTLAANTNFTDRVSPPSIEANTYKDFGLTLGGQTVVWSGTVLADTLITNSGYTVQAWIKEFTAGYGSFVGATTTNLNPGDFSISRAIAAGDIAQVGFWVIGPASTPGNTLGDVQITAIPEPSTVVLVASGLAGLLAVAQKKRRP
jgi:hypothetical protein